MIEYVIAHCVQYGGINVDCAVAEGAIKVVFQHYCAGFASCLIINHTISSHIDYYQKYVIHLV